LLKERRSYKKVKLSVSRPWSHMGEWRYSSIYSSLLHEKEVDGHRHVPTSSTWKGPEGTVGPSFGLDVMGKRKISYAWRDSSSRRFIP